MGLASKNPIKQAADAIRRVLTDAFLKIANESKKITNGSPVNLIPTAKPTKNAERYILLEKKYNPSVPRKSIKISGLINFPVQKAYGVDK